jgi:hypothetical protein
MYISRTAPERTAALHLRRGGEIEAQSWKQLGATSTATAVLPCMPAHQTL